ncbi:transcription factor [Hirsutella rhossiliensis]|uniref:Transcription factor opi1 domain-containing protein n=1 Tax=Hirsutella rhossiliensis TaxID=111463 RepID=A0A9P8N8T8_9HYPO|nr:transcription factor opi1 domain-containing protein [Hirsutella rhossiliensis]KAH0967844.1 transcription factor opi1 domain-containing protein [Hirsutella rhossiliensis]
MASMQFSPPPDIDPLPTKLPPLKSHDRDTMLPSLSSLTADVPPPPPSNWPTLNSPLAYRPPQSLAYQVDSPATMDLDASSVVSTATSDRQFDGASNTGLTLDDPDVRLAAEALGDLRADSGSLPAMSPRARSAQPTPHSRRPGSPQHEPLLSLLTTSHPLLASTIGGASSAYGGAKNFSPRFKSSAEYVEGYLTPIANTVNSVGRVTGVEGGVRWFLGANRRHASSSDSDLGGNSNKRRKVDSERDMAGQDHARGMQKLWAEESSQFTPRTPRRLSSTSTVDTLPAYDEMRSPAYTETTGPQNPPRSSPSAAPWQSRLIMSTSGLSVAMSAESLRSLKYCLRWLRWTNDHMGRVIGTLKSTLEEYERTTPERARIQGSAGEAGSDDEASEAAPEQSRVELANRINSLNGDVLKTLQDAINTVSKYAGGALPENARVLVRRHLTSLPQRFRVATMSSAPEGGDGDSESAIRDGAQKVLVLAKEGLDMVTQISGVVDGTIVTAEEWCERVGRKRQNSGEEEQEPAVCRQEPDGDVKVN